MRMFCEKCGNKLSESAKFCNKCGNPTGLRTESKNSIHKQIPNEEFAGFWIRLGAFIIDFTICLLVGVVISNLFNLKLEDAFGWGILLLPIYVILALSIYSTTIGKNIYGIKVVDEKDRNNIKVGKSIGRTISYLLSSFIIYMGFWTIGIDSKKQGWHDKIAGTLVLRDGSVDKAIGILFSIVAFGVTWAIIANM
jgi:uncharacterized RDD family membrane protein YckC/ribosomal protein L40E